MQGGGWVQLLVWGTSCVCVGEVCSVGWTRGECDAACSCRCRCRRCRYLARLGHDEVSLAYVLL